MRRDVITQCRLLSKRWSSVSNIPLHSPSKIHLLSTKSLCSRLRWIQQHHYSSCTRLPLLHLLTRHTGYRYSKAVCGCKYQLSHDPFLIGGKHKNAYSTSESAIETNTKVESSALYLRHGDSKNVAVVDVDLDLKGQIDNVKGLREDVRRRHLEDAVDIDALVSNFKRFSELEKEEEKLEEERESIAEQMKFLVKGKKKSPDFDEKKRTLIARGKDVREKLKLVQSDLWELEAVVMLTGLRLPTDLLPSTPDQNEVLDEHGALPDKDDRTSHKEIGEKLGYLSFSSVSSGACYLHGSLARLEQELVDLVCRRLRRAGLVQFSCPDMTKSLVMEGCGGDLTDAEEMFTLQLKAADIDAHAARGGDVSQVDKWDLLLNLCGASSLPAFASFLCKMNIARDCLPQQWFSIGRFYKPVKGVTVESPGLLALTQAVQASVFAVGEGRDQAEELYQKYVSLLWDMYKNCGLPVRLVKVGAPHLLRAEGAATHVEAWLPSADRYIKVAGVGVYNDFISRRLMIKHSEDVNDVYNRSYVNMVYGTALDVPRLLAVILESESFKREDQLAMESQLNKLRKSIFNEKSAVPQS